ncbi:MAG: NAD(+)/NADH kinase [Tissierellia bacterium]|nr:NAD(+)/NADH kinase [Tissierellia bacterium]
MSRIINIASNKEQYTLKIKNELINMLNKNGFICCEDFNPNAELNITIGGDGAFLRAVRDSNFSYIPFVGINTGTLGFFPEIKPENLDIFIENYKNKKFAIDEINLIECEIINDNDNDNIIKIYAVNDIVIKRKDMKTIHLEVFIDSNHLETISGDGIIISSPMGSSAYNFSAGGSLVYPSLKTLQITPLSPIISNAYRCLNCSVIVPPVFEVKIFPEKYNDYCIAFLADGVSYDICHTKLAKFHTSKKSIRRLITDNYNYWNVIKEKFL